MIKSLKLKNFRNFLDLELFFDDKKNFIIGENGKGKTNILEAIFLLTTNDLLKIEAENLVKFGENNFFIEAIFNNSDKLSLAYDKQLNKKIYSLNGKRIIKSKLSEKVGKTVHFLPMDMNIFYLSPSLRRSFLDEILITSYPSFEKQKLNYEKIIKNRNKLLKNIREQKSSADELDFWNEQFIKSASLMYKYRFKIVDFISQNIEKSKLHFGNKIEKIEFLYKTKVDKSDIETSIKNYLEKNRTRDIILAKTSIGIHVDDFDILLDSVSIRDFASRGETKSVILDLKKIQVEFVEEKTQKKVIVLIDDLFSELDLSHRKNILGEFSSNQMIISSIEVIETGEKAENVINI